MGLVILYWALLLVMVVGVIGSFVPALPGVILILGAIVVWGAVTGFAQTTAALICAIVVLVLTTAIDYLAGYLGAQKVGASNWGQIGSIVGFFLGMFGLLPALPVGGPIVGMFAGSMAGAFIGEFLFRRELALKERCIQGGKVSLAIVVSSLLGRILQGILAVAAMAIFVVTTWSQVM
jgi:uncharacterized protein